MHLEDDMNAEEKRLEESRSRKTHWKRWGPYVSDRAWGTVREDYSATGEAWEYFPHDHARSRAYRWNEDGLAAICDRHQCICFGLALWNDNDPILKERLFGLTGNEGNHGEDVKEYYFHLDSTPTHSYMKFLYKYPQRAFPMDNCWRKTGRRSKEDPEFELLDTGVFNENRYFDVVVEYAKAASEDILIRITAHNRGPEAARVHVIPTIWFRNTWSWNQGQTKPIVKKVDVPGKISTSRSSIRKPASSGSIARMPPRPSSPKMKRMPSASTGIRAGLRQGRHQRLHRRGKQRCCESRTIRDEGGRALFLYGSGGRSATIKLRLSKENPAARRTHSIANSTASSCCARKKPMSSTPR